MWPKACEDTVRIVMSGGRGERRRRTVYETKKKKEETEWGDRVPCCRLSGLYIPSVTGRSAKKRAIPRANRAGLAPDCTAGTVWGIFTRPRAPGSSGIHSPGPRLAVVCSMPPLPRTFQPPTIRRCGRRITSRAHTRPAGLGANTVRAMSDASLISAPRLPTASRSAARSSTA